MKLAVIIQKHYGLEVNVLQALEGGFRNRCFKVITPAKKFILIIYKEERDIEKSIGNAHFVAKVLSDQDFPTRIPIATKSGVEYFRQKFEDGYHFGALYNFLPGETIPWEAYTRRHLKSMGKTLSDMHSALRQIQNLKFKIQNWGDITKKEVLEMKKYLKKVEPWIEQKLKVRLKWVEIDNVFKKLEVKSEERNNILHYDFVRGNILFSKKLDQKLDIYPITGILDFEKVCIGPEIADIARTLAFLMIDCKFKREDTIRKRFLLSGYQKRGKNILPFSGITTSLLEALLKFFWLRDFWKYLEHNPYEYLYMNEHYIRTHDRLVKAGLLSKAVGPRPIAKV